MVRRSQDEKISPSYKEMNLPTLIPSSMNCVNFVNDIRLDWTDGTKINNTGPQGARRQGGDRAGYTAALVGVHQI